MKRLARALLPIVDFLLAPFVYPSALLMKAVRRAGVHRMPRCKRALLQMGVFPIRDHYYEPLFDGRKLNRPLDRARELPGIDWNIAGQLDLLSHFRFGNELKDIPASKTADLAFHFNNGAFEAGDAEYLYNLIRLKKPARIVEIGSGFSTLMAIRAVKRNQADNPGYQCRQLCIEPYEKPWLERTGVTVLRQRVEDAGKGLFAELAKDDILFIDSSHMIRPQGDVLFECLELLPALQTGVIVHVHDIFSPRDYPREWLVDEVKFWNEQYLLEAFLTCNRDWQVIGALNHLHHDHFQRLREKSPYLTQENEPGSFYMQKIS